MGPQTWTNMQTTSLKFLEQLSVSLTRNENVFKMSSGYISMHAMKFNVRGEKFIQKNLKHGLFVPQLSRQHNIFFIYEYINEYSWFHKYFTTSWIFMNDTIGHGIGHIIVIFSLLLNTSDWFILGDKKNITLLAS